MIAHERIPKKEDAEESEHRKEQRAEINRRNKHRAQRAGAPPPQPPHHREQRDERRKYERLRGVDLPARIDKNQLRRPSEFSQVKPDRPARDSKTLRPRLRPLSARRAGIHPLLPNRPRRRHG